MTAPNPWPWVGLLSATATASYVCRVNLSVAGALLMQELHLSQPQMGRLFSAFLLGYAVFMVPAGLVADRWGARRVFQWAALSWVGATLLQALVGHATPASGTQSALLTLLALRFLLGIAEAPTYPAAARGVSRWIPPRSQGRANGLVTASIALGSAIAPPLLSWVMVDWGWRTAVAVSALPALVVTLCWRAVGEPVPAADAPLETVRGGGGPGSLRSRSFVLLTLSYTLQGYVGYIFVFWFYLYLVQERHFDFLSGAFFGSLPWLLSIGSMPLGGWLSDRLAAARGLGFGRRAVPLVALTLAGVLLSLGTRTSSGTLAALYLALSTALVLAAEGPFWATMMELAGERSGVAGGIMNTGSNLGGLISPALTPVLAEAIGWENALHIAAVVSAVAGLLWLGIRPGGGEPQAPPA